MVIGVCLEYIPNKGSVVALCWKEFPENNLKINKHSMLFFPRQKLSQ